MGAGETPASSEQETSGSPGGTCLFKLPPELATDVTKTAMARIPGELNDVLTSDLPPRGLAGVADYFLSHLSPLPVCDQKVMTACRCCKLGGMSAEKQIKHIFFHSLIKYLSRTSESMRISFSSEFGISGG